MDYYVKSKLKEWKLERFVGIFRENEVSIKNFHLLTKDAIAGLIPTAGPRMTFLKNFEKLKVTEKDNSVQDFASSCSHDLQQEICGEAEDSSRNSSTLYKTNIKMLLSKNQAGRKILATLKSGKPPTNFLKKKLAVFLFDNLLESHGPNPSAQLKMEMAKAIVKEFPHLYIQKKHNVPDEETRSLEHQKESSENSNLNRQENEFQSSLPALEYYTDSTVRKVLHASDENNDYHYPSNSYSEAITNINNNPESDALLCQVENCDIRQSETLSMDFCEEPIIKKEAASYYESIHIVNESPLVEDTSANSSLAVTLYEGNGNEDVAPAANNRQDLGVFNVRDILERTGHGKKVLESLDHQNITMRIRRTMIRLLIQDLVDRFSLHPPTSVIEHLAVSIVEQFPFLNAHYGSHEAWYLKKKVGGKRNCSGFLFQRLSLIQKKHHSKNKTNKTNKKKAKARQHKITSSSINAVASQLNDIQEQISLHFDNISREKKEPLEEPNSNSKHQEMQYTDSELQKAHEQIMDQLNEICENMTVNYCQEKTISWQSNHEETKDRTNIENSDSAINYEDCVAVTNDDQFDNIDEMDGLTVVAYDDYCDLKCQNDMLEQEIKKERELRQNAEKKLAEVEAEKLALEQEILEYRNRKVYTRWKHNVVEYCRRKFQ